MKPLTRDDLHSLEEYAKVRPDFRARVMAHKKNRQVAVGPHATLYFEDRLTIQYQVQEMLRAERIFEPEGIAAELAAYNPLIPDGANLKATMMLEYADEAERRAALAQLIGIEARVGLRVDGLAPSRAVANEDLERDTADKTSAVHFLRFEFTPEMVRAAKEGASMSAGIDHQHYTHHVAALPDAVRDALVADFD